MQRSSTIGDLMERRRKMEGALEYDGHSYFDLMRFDENVRHMIIFDVLTHEAAVGDKGKRTRLYLSEKGYEKRWQNRKPVTSKLSAMLWSPRAISTTSAGIQRGEAAPAG